MYSSCSIIWNVYFEGTFVYSASQSSIFVVESVEVVVGICILQCEVMLYGCVYLFRVISFFQHSFFSA